jgi:hypothetical protein
VIPEAQDTKALRIQPRGACFVLLANRTMLTAVQLNNDLSLEAREIDDELTDGCLSAEPETTELPAAQLRPEPALGVGHVLS